ncbi:addiction module protein [Metallumcola ferriviriculae]|uniref:Addiction module protein n=1 Tax=Metallumcola ferriviriculae TaxID=3039180 RepID=A0AAU0UJR7_9FIRM|nr:addiction module protein [Desulfitibacteraceae bacterium MK1]
MSSKADELFSIIEDLPVDVKTALVEKILASIYPTQKEIEEEWKKEIEERVYEFQTGKVQLIPGEEVFKEIQEKFDK